MNWFTNSQIWFKDRKIFKICTITKVKGNSTETCTGTDNSYQLQGVNTYACQTLQYLQSNQCVRTDKCCNWTKKCTQDEDKDACQENALAAKPMVPKRKLV